jgi:hypothetical protein
VADDVIVYPAHGQEVLVVKHEWKPYLQLAIKKATNYALRADMNEAEFIQEVTDGLLPPAYLV